MRIRRYAARLLSSTTASPSSPQPPPPPAASWLHAAAAADDCCAFCELGRPAPQEGPDGIKHKGHIAGRVPESDVRADERVRQAQHPPAPEVKKCKTDHGPHVNKISVGLNAPRAASGDNEAALKMEADAVPAVMPGPFIANGDAIESDANKPEVSGGDHLVNGSATKLEVLEGAPVANETAHDPESKAATVPGVTSIAPEVTGAPSQLNISGTMLKVTSLARTEGTEGAEVIGAVSTTHKTTKLESAGEDYIAGEDAAGPDDSGGASSNVDDTSALDKPQLPSCSPNKGNVQLGNAEDTSTVQLTGCDAAKVGNSVNSRSNGPVGAKAPTVEGGMPNDRSVGAKAPTVSCLFDIVARSIGNSGRTDVICYARRRGKRKVELLEVKTENIELEDSTMLEKETLERNGRCESVLPTAGSADVKLADIKKELMDNSAASKAKKKKRNKFECSIDYCRMTFKTKTELSVHKKNMCTVKSCGRLFRSHKYLRRHQSVHNDDMPYKCPWDGCGMAFKWSWDRAEHFKIHAGVKPYKCTTPGCNKLYKFVSDFTRHRRRCKPQR